MHRSDSNMVSVVVVLLVFIINKTHSINDISGVTELTEHNRRKTPLHSELYDDAKHANLLLEKEKADIETVKQNIDAYQTLVKVDTQKLTGHQKDMVEKIVDRVARLKSVLNANATSISQSAKKMENLPHLDKIIFQLSPDYNTTTTLRSLPNVSSMTSVKVDQNQVRSQSSSTIETSRDSTSKFPQSTVPKLSLMNLTTKQSSGLQNHLATVGISSITSKTSSATNHSLVAIPLMQQKESNDTVNAHENFMNEKQEENFDATTAGLQSEKEENSIYETNGTTLAKIDTIVDHAREDYYTISPVDELTKKKKPSATAKPTKYHYYPHNQHIYLLPECAIQQVCNAVYVRLNYTQPLCACPSRYRDPCSASLNEDDQHTTKLIGNSKKKAITLAKTCEATTEMRECRSPKDWSLLALQNTRTGKSHYLVICRCPDDFLLEGPMAHDQPTYASVPGIRVFGMMCVSPRFSHRKPSVPPPRRQPPQKPFLISSSDHYSSNKNSRPTYDTNSHHIHHSSNYLNRPESTSNINYANPQDFVDNMSFSSFTGIYGRNNEKQNGNEVDNTTRAVKQKRATRNTIDAEFPWDKVAAFQNSIIWD